MKLQINESNLNPKDCWICNHSIFFFAVAQGWVNVALTTSTSPKRALMGAKRKERKPIGNSGKIAEEEGYLQTCRRGSNEGVKFFPSTVEAFVARLRLGRKKRRISYKAMLLYHSRREEKTRKMRKKREEEEKKERGNQEGWTRVVLKKKWMLKTDGASVYIGKGGSIERVEVRDRGLMREGNQDPRVEDVGSSMGKRVLEGGRRFWL